MSGAPWVLSLIGTLNHRGIGALNFMCIADHARSEGLVLVTNKLREFERVEGVRLENWVAVG